MHRTLEDPPALTREVVAEALESALSGRSAGDDAADALVGVALHGDDREFVEHCCVQVGTRAAPGSPLLGLAVLCLSHTARRFGRLSDETLDLARSLSRRAAADPADVDERALDSYDDIRTFLHLW
ncbi:hypothetical protein [Kitasatospora sp. NPDC058478]|uniref:hypothetical protein n=1 Tax=unclassified Kitasatospora TaxID=2633591 RepID=UPI003653B8FD